MEFKIEFSVQGYISQRVNITAEGWTAEKLQEAMNNGNIITTIQDGGQVLASTENDLIVIGTVVEVDNNLEYCDYEVEDEE